MKNTATKVNPLVMGALKTLCMAAFCLLFAMCSGKDVSPEQVAAKIDAGQTLTQEDYAAMIDYCGKYAKNVQQYYDVIDAQANDSTAEAVQAAQDLASEYAKYSYLDMFRAALYNINESQLDADNVKKVREYSSLEAFPLPGGAGEAMENPNVVGDIEQMPADSGEVISTGAGEAVDIQVK